MVLWYPLTDVRARVQPVKYMDRRSFLSGLVGAAATTQFDLEKLLWVPNRKRIFVPRFRDVVYGVGLAGDFTIIGLTERFAHLRRTDGAERSFVKWNNEDFPPVVGGGVYILNSSYLSLEGLTDNWAL